MALRDGPLLPSEHANVLAKVVPWLGKVRKFNERRNIGTYFLRLPPQTDKIIPPKYSFYRLPALIP
jgi:hypothetical protein